MREVWLRGNTRVLWVSTCVAAIVSGLGLALACFGGFTHRPLALVAGLIAALTPVVLATRLWRRQGARLQYASGRMRVLLGPQPIEVPIQFIECFLVGTSSSFLPNEKLHHAETKTLVVRLRENAPEWERRELDPRLGTWCGHHITIRGTWCEPLNLALVQRLNDRLVQEQRAVRGAS